MLNSTTISNKTVFNAPASGIIQKSNIKSFFVRMHQKSSQADKVFEENKYDREDIVVLQILLSHEGWLIVELIYKKDFEG